MFQKGEKSWGTCNIGSHVHQHKTKWLTIESESSSDSTEN